MLPSYIAVGFDGAFGAIARVALSKILPNVIFGIPFQILFVNILGCFLMGILTELITLNLPISQNLKYFLISGFLGGFTTFSAFSFEFGSLFEKSDYLAAIFYATLSFGLSIGLFFVGTKIIRIFS